MTKIHVIRRKGVSPDTDCNCACALSLPPTSVPANKSVPWVRDPMANATIGGKGWKVYVNLQGSSPVVALDSSACRVLEALKSPLLLRRVSEHFSDLSLSTIENIVADLAQAGLIHPAENPNTTCPTETDVLVSWLHVSDRCNLRCDYCYSPHTRADMTYVTGRAVVDAIFRSALAHGYQKVKLKYAGGEPLLRFDLVKKLHAYALVLSEHYEVSVDGVILSNGTLITPEIVQSIKSLGLRLMISIDGIGEFHDCQRHFPLGGESFTAVARGTETAVLYGLTPDISVTVSGRSVAGLPDLMTWVVSYNLPFSVNFYRENEESLSKADLSLNRDEVVANLLAAYKVIKSSSPYSRGLAGLIDRANFVVPHLYPCGAGHSYLVFDTLGRVSKCQMDMDNIITDSRDPDPLSSIRKSNVGVYNPPVDEKVECSNCKWRYWCAGGCPLQAYRVTGRYTAPSPYCEIYRDLFPAVINLESARLLEYAIEMG